MTDRTRLIDADELLEEIELAKKFLDTDKYVDSVSARIILDALTKTVSRLASRPWVRVEDAEDWEEGTYFGRTEALPADVYLVVEKQDEEYYWVDESVRLHDKEMYYVDYEMNGISHVAIRLTDTPPPFNAEEESK